MKKLLFILTLALMGFTIQAQTSTIEDWGLSVKVCEAGGDTLSFPKEGTVVSFPNAYIVKVSHPGYGVNGYKASDFTAFSDNYALYDYLDAIFQNKYDSTVICFDDTYTTTPDTIKYYYNSAIECIQVLRIDNIGNIAATKYLTQ